MSEPTTPDTPSTPTSGEAAALAVLDVRGRRAATRLRTAVDRLVAEDPPAGAAAPRRGRGRTWLIAATVLAVAGLVAAVTLLLRADDQEGMVTDEGPGYLVPGWLPDGWELQEARDLRANDTPGALTGTVTVYGDPDADDPWTGPTLSVWHASDDRLGHDEGDDVEEITVGGLPATIEDGGSTLIVRILDGDAMVLVMAYQLERPVVLAAAGAAVSGDDAGVRPEGFERIASGPLSAAGTVGGYAIDGLSLLYGGASSDAGQLVVLQRAGDRDDAELLRLMSAEAETTEVRGLPAYATDGILQWYEPAARAVVTVVGGEVDASVLEQSPVDCMRPGRARSTIWCGPTAARARPAGCSRARCWSPRVSTPTASRGSWWPATTGPRPSGWRSPTRPAAPAPAWTGRAAGARSTSASLTTRRPAGAARSGSTAP